MSRRIEDTPSPNHDARPDGGAIDMLVIHYTGMQSAKAARERLCDPASKVSAHYVIDEDGSIAALVPEDRRAWHAGVSFWRGHTDINARSVGVELVNPGHEYGYRPFPEPQMAAFEELAKAILGRHSIPARNVVGHSDVAPRRKEHPGELFDWRHLAGCGIGLWPDATASADADDVMQMLGRFGYETEDAAATLRAFQRRFRPARIDGVGDAETTGLLADLLRRVG